MIRHASTALLLTGLLVVGLTARGDETLGEGVALREATPIQKLYHHPEEFVGKAVRIDGVVSAVCEEMGCWMALADIVNPELAVRFKVEDGGPIVFPIAAKGKAASAEGVFERIAAGDEHAAEAATEHAAQISGSDEFGQTYQIKATGAVIR